MGGPALHVAYLTAGLAERGYETTLVAGSLAHGEDSMAFVADELGIEVERIDELHREISPVRDAVAILRLARLIRRVRPHILHTHTAKAGAVGRLAALLAGGARPPIVVHTFHGHVLRGYFDPVRTAGFRLLERLLARRSTALVAVSPQVRDDLVALGVAPRKRFTVVRLGVELADRVAADGVLRDETRPVHGNAPGPFVVCWIGRMTGRGDAGRRPARCRPRRRGRLPRLRRRDGRARRAPGATRARSRAPGAHGPVRPGARPRPLRSRAARRRRRPALPLAARIHLVVDLEAAPALAGLGSARGRYVVRPGRGRAAVVSRHARDDQGAGRRDRWALRADRVPLSAGRIAATAYTP